MHRETLWVESMGLQRVRHTRVTNTYSLVQESISAMHHLLIHLIPFNYFKLCPNSYCQKILHKYYFIIHIENET